MTEPKEPKLTLDNIVYVYEDVPQEDFQKIVDALTVFTTMESVADMYRWIGKRPSEYRYNVKIGDGEGAILIQYQHNSEKDREHGHNMRVEFNPAKIADDVEAVFRFLQGAMYANIRVTSIDVAVDVAVPITGVWITPKTGRNRGTFNTTQYYGNSGHNGYLKVYDKKKEREDAGYAVEEPHLTRIEFRWKGNKRIDELNTLELNFSRFYDVRFVDYEEIGKAELMCMIRGVLEGWAQLKDFTRTNQRKIKEALERMATIDVDALFQAHKTEIIRTIQRYALGRVLDVGETKTA